ncbi:MAG: T9SS type A sorting domain-containing protein, partial [Bacteroidota bacterium]
ELALASSLESLILDNNELSDAMPMSFASALNMKYLSLRNNNIDQLPDFSGIPGLTHLLVDGNKLTFEDLEPNANLNGTFSYSPQQDVYQFEVHDLSIGDDFSLESQIGGTQNEYTWFKDGFILVGSNTPQLQLETLGFEDAGTYWATITSPLLPNLSLKRMDIQINMSSPLPVELTRFQAELDGSRVILDWETATEYNNAYFEIERSKDGEIFEVIERINGAGTTQEPRTYRGIDIEPYIGVSYYRLHQVDFDGQDSYSDIRVIHNQTTFEILAYPSPVARGGIMSVLINMKGNLHVRLYDSQSRLLQQRNMWHQNGELLVDLSTAALVPGNYLVVVSNGDETSSQKVVVQ